MIRIKDKSFEVSIPNEEIQQKVKALAEKVLSHFGKIDVLVNNAGVAYQNLFQLADEKKIKEVLDINLMSALSLTKEILPSMISEKWGRIINISSTCR